MLRPGRRRLCLALLLAAALPGAANAGEPNHGFDGGTPAQQATVHLMLGRR